MPTRRAVMGAFTTSALLFSGCNALTINPNDGFVFAKLELWNDDDAKHRLHLLIEADGEPIYWGSYEIPSNPGDTVGEKEFDPRNRLDGKVQQLTLRGRVDDQPPVGPVEITAEETTDPAKVSYLINEDSELDISNRVVGD